jgi:hypothetical protein
METTSKKIWVSKTLWVNILAIAALLIQAKTGYVLEPDTQIYVLGVLNVVLRFVTKEAITW